VISYFEQECPDLTVMGHETVKKFMGSPWEVATKHSSFHNTTDVSTRLYNHAC
jgi:hypothetical protein